MVRIIEIRITEIRIIEIMTLEISIKDQEHRHNDLDKDRPPSSGLDTSCEAELQGFCRMGRLHAFAQYINDFYRNKAKHKLLSVAGVGHNGYGMYQSPEFLQDVFSLL